MQMRRSMVLGTDRLPVTDGIRTSYGTFLKRAADPTLARVERRLAAWTHLPVENQEDLQVRACGQSRPLHHILACLPSPAKITLGCWPSQHPPNEAIRNRMQHHCRTAALRSASRDAASCDRLTVLGASQQQA